MVLASWVLVAAITAAIGGHTGTVVVVALVVGGVATAGALLVLGLAVRQYRRPRTPDFGALEDQRWSALGSGATSVTDSGSVLPPAVFMPSRRPAVVAGGGGGGGGRRASRPSPKGKGKAVDRGAVRRLVGTPSLASLVSSAGASEPLGSTPLPFSSLGDDLPSS